jgi:hypothetical protein
LVEQDRQTTVNQLPLHHSQTLAIQQFKNTSSFDSREAQQNLNVERTIDIASVSKTKIKKLFPCNTTTSYQSECAISS